MGKEGQNLGVQLLTRKSYHISKPQKTVTWGKRRAWICKQLRIVGFVFGLLGSFFLLDSVMLTLVHHISFRNGNLGSKLRKVKDGGSRYDINQKNTGKLMYEHLINLASTALAKNDLQQDPFAQWKEHYEQASSWKPCADKSSSAVHEGEQKMS